MVGDAEFWDRIAPKYAKRAVGNPAAYAATLDRVRAHLSPGDRVLETGCGTGTTALALADSVTRYTATDQSAAMIALARTKAAEAGQDKVEFHVAPAADTLFAPESFDAVLAFNLLHLLRDLPAAIARAHDLLVPGGLFISKSACLANMNPLVRLAVPVLRAIGKAPFVQSFNRAALEERIRRGGFEIVEARAFEGAPAAWFVVARKPRARP